MSRRFLIFVAAMAVYMPLLLLTDRAGLGPQLTLGLTTAAFLFFATRSSPVPKIQIVATIIVATLGEVVLSLGWGLYSYAYAIIPLYVPPGHGLFFALAAESAHQEALKKKERIITKSVLIIGSLIAVASLILFGDSWGFLWWLGALALIRFTRNQLMFSTCFVFTIVLEWMGTAIGNWQWFADVPYVGLTSANPPSGVGILYILLDLIVMGVTSKFVGGRTPLPEPLTLDSAVTTDN